MKRPAVGDAAWQTLTDYVTAMQAEFHVEHWEVTILTDELPDADTTEIEQTLRIEQDTTEWRIGDRFFDQEPEEQRTTVVHEMIHMHMWHSWSDLAHALEAAVPSSAWEIMRRSHEKANERDTERLARAIAPKYDLIEWPTSQQETESDG